MFAWTRREEHPHARKARLQLLRDVVTATYGGRATPANSESRLSSTVKSNAEAGTVDVAVKPEHAIGPHPAARSPWSTKSKTSRSCS